jgi:hypothetical protein
MTSHIESLLKSHDWPLGARIGENAIAFDLASHSAEWDEIFTTLSGAPAERLRIMKLAAMHAFWQATLEGKKRAVTGRN